jgi:hypothetical protein
MVGRANQRKTRVMTAMITRWEVFANHRRDLMFFPMDDVMNDLVNAGLEHFLTRFINNLHEGFLLIYLLTKSLSVRSIESK